MKEHRDKYVFDINSKAFEGYLKAVNNAIVKCLDKTVNGKHTSGEITTKIIIEILECSEPRPTGFNNNYSPSYRMYNFKKPKLEYKVSLTLKEQESTKGDYDPGHMEVRKDNDSGNGYIMSQIKPSQLFLGEC